MEDIIERFKARDEEDQRQVAANKGRCRCCCSSRYEKGLCGNIFVDQKTEGGTRCEKEQEGYRIRYSSFLREKAELDAELKREELKIREQEMKDKKTERDNLHAQQQAMSAMLHESMQQQQQQQAQLMQQIQLQNAALMSLLSKQK